MMKKLCVMMIVLMMAAFVCLAVSAEEEVAMDMTDEQGASVETLEESDPQAGLPETGVPASLMTEVETEPEETHETYRIAFAFPRDGAMTEHIEWVQDNETVDRPVFTPELDGHTFRFWYDPAQDFEEGIIVEYAFGGAAVRNVTLRAMFEANGSMDEPAYEEITDEATAVLDSNGNKQTLPSFITILDDEEEDEYEQSVILLQDAGTPLAGPSLAPKESELMILLCSNHSACMSEGDRITVSATLVGYDDCTVALQWQYNDGEGWKDAQDGSGLSYSFEATSQTVNYDWRIAVTVLDAIEA